MDYETLIAELDYASKQCGHYSTSLRIRKLFAYLTTLQETGNYLLAEKAEAQIRE